MFVSNRVQEIIELTNPNEWHYVSTKHNPADVLTRGATPTQLTTNSVWWKGPDFLAHSENEWPMNTANMSTLNLPELKTTKLKTFTVVTPSTIIISLINNLSSYSKLLRVLAYVFRFIAQCKGKTNLAAYITTKEYQTAHIKCIQAVQIHEFHQEIRALKQNNTIDNHSKLRSLKPFLDEDNILHVGGRLEHAKLSYLQKHPIILPAKHEFTKLLIKHIHEVNLHIGQQGTLAAVRYRYWPLSAKSTIRHHIQHCMRCYRARPTSLKYTMGNLPVARLQSTRAFLHCGVDFAGPLQIKEGSRRSKKTIKAYACIFVCFATKAVHIEAVSSLTAEAFLATLRRFMARRGQCATIYSDNGTNFVGANKELKQLYTSININKDVIGTSLASRGIEWKFMPARSPHFGGLYEAAVKSMKGHLRRIIGNEILTFEELTTTLTQIEACLNSRPLTPISSDPTDLTILTPSHFLIGDSLTAAADPDLRHIRINQLSRWQHCQQLTQHFWCRFQKEYLHQLQARSKWMTMPPNQRPIHVGTMVLIKDDNLPPLHWSLGRITAVHPGEDGVVRVVTVKTIKGDVKRATNKLSALPIEDDNCE